MIGRWTAIFLFRTCCILNIILSIKYQTMWLFYMLYHATMLYRSYMYSNGMYLVNYNKGNKNTRTARRTPHDRAHFEQHNRGIIMHFIVYILIDDLDYYRNRIFVLSERWGRKSKFFGKKWKKWRNNGISICSDAICILKH